VVKAALVTKKAPIVAKISEQKDMKPVYKTSSSEDLKKLPKFEKAPVK